MQDTMTLFSAIKSPKHQNPNLSKRFELQDDGSSWNKKAFDLAFWWRPTVVPVDNLRDVAEVIEVIREERNAILVRGEVLPEIMDKCAADPEFFITKRKYASDKD
jgi:hypothetical protein